MEQYFYFDVKNPISSSDYETLFQLMSQAFPKSEMRSYENQKALLDNPFYHLLVRKDDNQLTAFFAYWKTSSICFGEHFAVDENLRGQGVGGLMLGMLTESSPSPFVLEVEPPETETAKRRIAFYERHGFHLNSEYPYFQPSLQDNLPPLPLIIMSHGTALNQENFLRLQKDLYENIYGVKNL